MLNHFADTGAAGDRSTAGPHPDADSNPANLVCFDTWSGLSCYRMTWQVTREVVEPEEPEEPEEPGTPVVPAETQDSSSDSSDLCTARHSAKRPCWSCTWTRGVPPLSVAISKLFERLWVFPFTTHSCVWSQKSAVAKADAGGCLCRWRHVNFNRHDPFRSFIPIPRISVKQHSEVSNINPMWIVSEKKVSESCCWWRRSRGMAALALGARDHRAGVGLHTAAGGGRAVQIKNTSGTY